MNKKIVRIWTDVEVDANTEEGAMMSAAAKVIADAGTSVEWNFMILMSDEEYAELMSSLEQVSAEGVEEVKNTDENSPA